MKSAAFSIRRRWCLIGLLVVVPAYAGMRLPRNTFEKSPKHPLIAELKEQLKLADDQIPALGMMLNHWPDREINIETRIERSALSFLRFRVIEKRGHPEIDSEALGKSMVEQKWKAIKAWGKQSAPSRLKPISLPGFFLADTMKNLGPVDDDTILALFAGSENQGGHDVRRRLYVAIGRKGSQRVYEVSPQLLVAYRELEVLSDNAIALKILEPLEFLSLVFHNGGAPEESPLPHVANSLRR